MHRTSCWGLMRKCGPMQAAAPRARMPRHAVRPPLPHIAPHCPHSIAIGIIALGCGYGVFLSAGPQLYWHVYSTFLRPFHDTSFSALGDDPFSAALAHSKLLFSG